MNMLELLNTHLDGPLMERLGAAQGLDPAQARRIGAAVLPAQVAILSRQASTEAGARQLLDLSRQVPQGRANDVVTGPGGPEQLQQSGAALLPQLLGSDADAAAGQVAAQTGAPLSGVLGMMQMVLPLVLGVVGQQATQQNLDAGQLGRLFTGGVDLPGGAAASLGATGLGATGLGATGLGAGLAAGAAGLAATGPNAPSLNAASDLGRATVGAGAGLNGGVLHTNPALGGSRGLGRLWLLPLLLLVLLGGCFLLRGKPAGTETTPGHSETVGTPGHTEAAAPSTPSTPAAATPSAAAATFALLTPAAGSTLAAGAFDLSGTGQAGEVLEVFEDGVNLGKTTVGADNRWTLNVASPAAGPHTYTVKQEGGAELGSVQTTVSAAAASTGACTKAFSLSMKDGQSVAQPFRFGGVGSGKSYTVTITRGERKIGSKVLPLDGACGYSYTSKPGKGEITYAVSPTGSADVASKITVTVK